MARQPEGSPVRAALVEQYGYDGEQTCAADGSCRLACPVAIDTGKLIKELRVRAHGARAERRALRLAERWATVERAGRAGLRAGGADGADRRRRGRAGADAAALRRLAGDELRARVEPRRCPARRRRRLPATAARGRGGRLPARLHQPHVRHLAARRATAAGCPQALVEVSARAGLPVWIPPDAPGHCCATPVELEGLSRGPRAHGARVSPTRCGAGPTAARCRS